MLTLFDQSNNPRVSHDADYLYRECVKHEIDTDWWISKANTVRLIGGEHPSVAYLLLPRNDGASVSQSTTNLKLTLEDSFQSFDIRNWFFHSAKAITPSDDPQDPNTIYLVKFVDRRFLFARSVPTLNAYNLVSEFVSEPSGTYDATNASAFPYNPDTLNTGVPWKWRTLLVHLWNTLSPSESVPSLVPILPGTPVPLDDVGADSILPAQVPLDIRPEGRSSWKLFCDLIHSIGFEIYPQLDGTWKIIARDYLYGEPFPLSFSAKWLIDTADSNEAATVLPATFRIGFQVRRRNSVYKHRNQYHFLTFDSATLAATITDPTVTPIIVSGTETFITEAMTAVFKDATGAGNPENQTDLTNFGTTLVTRLIRHRISTAIEQAYSRFIDTPPSTFFDEIIFREQAGEISTSFHTLPMNPESLPPEIDRSGTAVALPSSVRFKLLADRTRTEPVSDSVLVDFIDSNDLTVLSLQIVYDEDRRYFGPAGSRGVAVSTDYGYKICSMEDLSHWGQFIIDGRFDYEETFAAPIQSVHNWWGPPDQYSSPAGRVANIFDPYFYAVNAQPEDSLITVYRSDTDLRQVGTHAQGYFVAYPPYPPQLLWAWADDVSQPEEEVHAVEADDDGIYTGRLIRKIGSDDPKSNDNYEQVTPIRFFFIDGSTPKLFHKRRLAGFRVANAGEFNGDLYAVITSSSELVFGRSKGEIPAAIDWTINHPDGEVEILNNKGEVIETVKVKSRYSRLVPDDTPCWILRGPINFLVNADCGTL